MSFLNLFKLEYWFSQPAILYGGKEKLWYLFILSLIIIGFIFKFLQKKSLDKAKAEIYRRSGNLFVSFSIFLIFWFFVRQQYVPFLAWRFWWLLALFFAVSAALKIMRYMLKRIPEIRKFEEEKKMREKYLVKNK